MPPDVVMVTVGGDGLTATPSFCHAMVGEPVAEQVKVACDPIDTVELTCCFLNILKSLSLSLQPTHLPRLPSTQQVPQYQ